MAIMTRLSRLFQSDLHAVLDSIEEPRALLKQAIRDMEEALDKDRQTIKLQQQECERLTDQVQQLQYSAEKLEQELEVCFQANNEILARATIKRQLQTKRLQEAVKQRLVVTEKDLSELQNRFKENQLRFDSMQQKAEVLEDEKTHAYERDGFEISVLQDQISEDEIEVAFLQAKQNRQQVAQE